MKTMVLAFLMALTAISAQEPRKHIQKVIELKHAHPEHVARVIQVFGLTVQTETNMRVIAIAGPAEVVAAAEEAIKGLDVPKSVTRRANIEATFYVVMGSQKATESGKLPADLEPVVKQLKAVSNYQGFKVLDTIIIRSREGSGSDASGVLPIPTPLAGGPPNGHYQLRFQHVTLSTTGKDNTVVFDNLRFSARLPQPSGTSGQWQMSETAISTNVDVREGQKVVVGKTNVEGPDSAMILVVTAKVLE